MDAITLPAKWQEWRIVEAIGEGSFGTVYRAEKDDGVVKSVSAIKVVEIAADDARMSGLNRRFRSEEALREYLWSVVDHCAEEIRTMYRLQGESSIVSIQDHAIEALEGRVGWRLFIRMEYLQGFDDYLTTHEFTQRDIIRMGISLCGALEKCEKLNILHRDIKPENIFVSSSGEFKLGDFGISRVLEETRASLTSEGTFGTMAPEVYKGQPCGKEADIYSLGLVLYTLANRGCEPFIDAEKQMPSYGELQAAFERRMKGDPLPLPAEASPALQRALLRACAYKPSARYRSAAEFRAALEPLMRVKKRPPLKRIALAAALALLAAAAVVLFVPGVRLRLFPMRYESAGIRFTIPWRFAKKQTGDGNTQFYGVSGDQTYFIEFIPPLPCESAEDCEAALADRLEGMKDMTAAPASEGDALPHYLYARSGASWNVYAAALYGEAEGRGVAVPAMLFLPEGMDGAEARHADFLKMVDGAKAEG